MLRHVRLLTLVLLFGAVAVRSIAATPAVAAAATSGVDDDVNAALQKLYASAPVAKMIGAQARAVLVFPNIVKAGFIVGGEYGAGALVKEGKIVGQYNSVAGLQCLGARGPKVAFVLFLDDWTG